MLIEARQHSLAAMEMQPNWPDAYLAMGNITLAEQNYPEAESFYRVALSKSYKSASLVNNIGITLAEQGQINEVIKAFKAALEMEPTLVEAQKNLALYQTVLSEDDAP